MVKNIAWKIRIYPNKEQTTLINKTLGCCRFIYNKMLYERMEVYSQYQDNKRELYEYKYKTEKDYKNEFEWLKEVDAIALQQARRNLSSAYQNFFKSLSGKRKGEKAGFPKFHKKGCKDTYRTQCVGNNIKIDLENRKICLPKIGWISYRDKRTNIEGRILNATVSKSKTGKYFVSIILEKECPDITPFDLDNALEKGLFVKGLDMSLEHFYVDENGNSPEYIRLFRKYEDRIAHLQRKVSKKKLGSNNRKKTQHKVNVIYEKIANSRKDFIEKLSTSLVHENDAIVIESLSLKGMSQALNLGKSVMDLGYSLFIKRLEEKANDLGKFVIKADKWFASSKTCSTCGYVYKDLALSEREWICPNCGTHHLRDMNAGQNLRNYGLNLIFNTGLDKSVEPLEVSALVEPEKKEALRSLA